MARLFSDSFDFYNGAGDIGLTYTGTLGNVPSTNTAFGVGQSLGPQPYSASVPTFTWGSNEATVYGSVRINFMPGSGPNPYYFAIWLEDMGTVQCAISWWSDGSIRLHSGTTDSGTLLHAAYPAQFAQNSWDSWQFKLVISTTAGSIELRKNGNPADVISLSSVNTQGGTANAYANGAALVWNTGSPYANWLIDDLFISSGSGAAPNGWLGDLRAYVQTPAGNVTSAFTRFPSSAASNAACLAEVKEDGDTSYITAAASGTEDTFSLTAIPTSYTVVGVNYVAAWRKTDSGALIALLTLQASGVAETTEISQAALGTSYSFSHAWLPLDPAGAAWTPANVNGAVVGLKIQ